MRRFGAPLLFLLPASVLILLFFIIPVFVTIALSLTDLSTATIRNPILGGFR